MSSPSSRRSSFSGRLAAPAVRPSSASPASSYANPPLQNIPPRISPSPNASGFQSALAVDKQPVADAKVSASNLSASLGKAAQQQQPAGLSPQPTGDSPASPAAAAGLSPPAVASGGPSTPSKDYPSEFSLDNVPDEEKARILNRHLVSASERRGSNAQSSTAPDRASLRQGASAISRNESGVSLGDSNGSQAVAGGADSDAEEFSIPYDSQGGDVTCVPFHPAAIGLGRRASSSPRGQSERPPCRHRLTVRAIRPPPPPLTLLSRHDLYKWAQTHGPPGARKARSASFSHPTRADEGTTYQQIKEPGGFRRNYIRARARERGEESPRVLRNVIDFLFIYGHFVRAPRSCRDVGARRRQLNAIQRPLRR